MNPIPANDQKLTGPGRFQRIIEQAHLDGLWVLPACEDPTQKHPCVDWTPYQSRRPSPEEDQFFIEHYPHRNGTYVTGPELGRFVLDADGLEANEWVELRGGVDVAQIIESRPHHRQYHFAYPPDFRVITRLRNCIAYPIPMPPRAFVGTWRNAISAAKTELRWLPARYTTAAPFITGLMGTVRKIYHSLPPTRGCSTGCGNRPPKRNNTPFISSRGPSAER